MQQNFDVVVVGAGILGCATAYFLSLEGMKVCVMDREAIASGGSAHATGYLGAVGGDLHPGPYFSLIVAGGRLYRTVIPEIEAETGVDTLYQTKPAVYYALDDGEAQQVNDLAQWRQAEGLEVEWLTAEDLRKVEPRFGPEIVHAVLSPSEGQADSSRLTVAFAQAAEKHGTTFLLRQVTGLLKQGQRVTGVQWAGGSLSCDHTVLSLGAWSKSASEWLDTPIPIEPLKGQRIELRFAGEPVPIILMNPRYPHLLSRRDGLISHGSSAGTPVTGYGSAEEYTGGLSFDLRPTEDIKLQLLAGAQYLMPCLEEAELVRQWAGVRPNSPDGWPILGSVPGWEGVYLASGHRGRGVTLGAISGKLIAELIAKGAPSISLDPFSLARFQTEKGEA